MTTMRTQQITHTRDYVNWLRMKYTDVQVAKMLDITSNSITRVYWTRSELKLPYLWEWKSRKWVEKCKYKEERILKTDKWEYNNDKPYWDTDTEIELYNRPASFTKFNQNSLWQQQ